MDANGFELFGKNIRGCLAAEPASGRFIRKPYWVKPKDRR